jgi:DNA-binding GntR family transcriptional regulator
LSPDEEEALIYLLQRRKILDEEIEKLKEEKRLLKNAKLAEKFDLSILTVRKYLIARGIR